MTICKNTLVKCPYCGVIGNQHFEIYGIGEQKIISTCETPEGGCGKDFVIKHVTKLEIKTLKIEGK